MSDSVVVLFVGGQNEMQTVCTAWSGWRVHALASAEPLARLSASLSEDGGKRATADDVHMHAVDFTDIASVSALLMSLVPFRALVIWPTFDLTGPEGWEKAMDSTMGRCFCAVRAAYLPLIRQRQGSLWIVGPEILRGSTTPDEIEACIQPCSRGLASLAGVVAMELAKKGVIANYLDRGDGAGGLQQAIELIRWTALQPKPYLTAESLALRATRTR